MFRNKFRHLMMVTIVITCIMNSKGYSADPNVSLDTKLIRIISQDKGNGTNIQNQEDQCLSLLSDYNSPEDKGKIYAKIAFIYSSHGYSSPNDIRIKKTGEYCRKALDYPLDLLTTCETYTRLSGSEIGPYIDAPETEFIKARKESIITCLKGLKLVLDSNAPKEWRQPPGVFKYVVNDDNPDYNRIVQEHERQIEARRHSEIENKLFILRRALIDRCVVLYAHKPYDTEEFVKYAQDALKGHEDAVEEIIAKIDEKIPQQDKK